MAASSRSSKSSKLKWRTTSIFGSLDRALSYLNRLVLENAAIEALAPRFDQSRVDLPLSEADLDQYEWKEEGKVYREWLIPAAIINKYWWPK
jgi:hypothetical protein